jgi:hypothetical protein
MHVDAASGAYIPKDAFKNSLLQGVKLAGLKEGRRSAYGIVEATVFPTEHLYLGKQTFDQVFETPARIPPRTGSLVIIRYPMFNQGWSAKFSLLLAMDRKDIVGFVQDGLESAGLLVGVGSWRPEYGRFMVSDVQVEQRKAA